MKRATLILGTASLALAGILVFETRQTLARRAPLRIAEQRAALLAAEIAKLRSERDAAVRDLAQAERQLASLPPPRPEDPALSPARRGEIDQWMARVQALRQRFAARPEQRIPEMEFLQDADWLRVAKHAQLDSDDGARKALADIRGVAVERFLSQQVTPALQQFTRSTRTDSAPTISALTPFLSRPADASLLERYELTANPRPSLNGGTEWKVQNTAPIDPDYDSRYHVIATERGNYSTGSSYAPTAWIPDFATRLQQAVKAFRSANQTAPSSGLADVLPFFNPPLDPLIAERILRADRERRR